MPKAGLQGALRLAFAAIKTSFSYNSGAHRKEYQPAALSTPSDMVKRKGAEERAVFAVSNVERNKIQGPWLFRAF